MTVAKSPAGDRTLLRAHEAPVTRHVLHVLGQLNPSGAEAMLRAALPVFKEAGVETTLLSTGAQPGPYAPQLAAAGAEIRHLPFGRNPAFFAHLLRVFREPQWSAIHLHTERGNFYFGMLALASGKTALRTVHNAFEFEGNLRWRRGLQRRLLHRLGLPHVAISPSVAANEQQRFGLATVQIDNWFDDMRFRPPIAEQRQLARREFGVPEPVGSPARFVIASVGNCSHVKNHASLLRALARFAPAERPYYLHAGVEDAAASERALAGELGIEADVKFLGNVSDVASLLRAADAFAMPSLYEGFGVAAVEALGSGVRSVFADVPGLRDFKGAFPDIVYCGTDEVAIFGALSHTLDLWKASPSWAPLVAQADEARHRFGVRRGVDAYLSLYQRAGARNRHGHQ